MSRLQIYDPRERALVGTADRVLTVARVIAAPFRRRRRPDAPSRILLLRMERIGDLVMALQAIADVRCHAPDAEIDLVIGRWNAPLARGIPGLTHVETIDAKWLSRDVGGFGMGILLQHARQWRRRRYDLAINFEPDVRSNLLLAASGAAWTAGFASGGGGPLLDFAIDYDTREHTSENARRLVARIFGRTLPETPHSLLRIPESAVRAAAARLADNDRGPQIGVHVSGGRAIKQWEPERFGEVARRLVEERHATIVLTGERADRSLVDATRAVVPARKVVDLTGELDLLTLAALLGRLNLLVTGDTGPMHLAAAVGTPVVAVFGPSDPARYAPLGCAHRIVRVDLPCSPCNRIRLPPSRCVGHTPDCLALVSADRVFEAAISALDAPALLARNAGA